MLCKCISTTNSTIILELDKLKSESTPADHAVQSKASIIPFSSKISITKGKKFKEIPFERLIIFAELLQ